MPLYVNQGSGSVRGDTEQTVPLPDVGASVPENGPVMNMSRFSGEYGPVPGSSSSQAIRVAMPLPPT